MTATRRPRSESRDTAARDRGRPRWRDTLTATRIAFTVIVLFVLAQVTWWLIFQERYLSNVTETRLAGWRADALTANELLAASPASALSVRSELLERFPHLAWDGERFEVDSLASENFLARQRGYIRMFAFEAPFFVLVVMVSLLLIGSSLRAERELKRRQQNFLSAVTHEFKTPLSTLRLLVETALMRPLSEERSRDYLERMAAEVGRLEQTSEQVLAAARIEQREEQAALTELDLGAAVKRITTRLRPGLEARGARLSIEIAEEPLPVYANEEALGLVVGNLLDNAVKYSPSDVKPVRVQVERSNDLALIHVEDEGTGIGPGEERRIFGRFYRSGDELTREAPGIGLGLHLVRSTVEGMNGWVRCANRDDGPGARFTVVLPLRVGRTGEPSAGRADRGRQ